VDRATVEYLQSTAPDPSQSSLDAVLADTIRVRVVDNEVTGKRTMSKRAWVLAEFSDITSIAKLRDCLQIIEEPAPSRHCMCVGDEVIELHTSAGRIETISLHHEYSLRWHAWSGDATLADNRRLLNFLADRGVPAPLERHEQAVREADEATNAATRAAARWHEAMPACLAPFSDGMRAVRVDVHPLRETLVASVPDPMERARVLFRWFGSGAGPWTEYPIYENVVGTLLLAEPTTQLVEARREAPDALSDVHLEGAARYFSGWEFNLRKRNDLRLLAPELRQSLLTHVLQSTDAEKIELAREALAD